jgi:hypothetical protein
MADLNLDGRPDVVQTSVPGGDIAVLLGNGDGSLRAPVRYATDLGARSAAVGDLNGDGKPDVVVINQDGNDVNILLNTTP